MALPNMDAMAEAGKWMPHSPYFRHYWRRAQEREMAESNTPPQDPKIGFCPTCGLAFLVDETRQWSPCHGTDPTVVLEAFTAIDLLNALAERVTQENRGAETIAASQGPESPLTPAESPTADPIPTPETPVPPSLPPGATAAAVPAASDTPSNGASKPSARGSRRSANPPKAAAAAPTSA